MLLLWSLRAVSGVKSWITVASVSEDAIMSTEANLQRFNPLRAAARQQPGHEKRNQTRIGWKT